jgi:nitrate reductase (NAD(P)H)
MMNNWYFRVAVTREVVDGRDYLHFEHPTMAGVVPGGWMEVRILYEIVIYPPT